MNFIINTELLLKDVSVMTTAFNRSNSTSSVIECFNFETQSSKRSSTIDNAGHECNSSYEMPSIAPYNGPIPARLIGFNEGRCEKVHHGTIHFYIDDRLFNCTWNNPDKYVPLLRQYDSVIGPDFSQYVDMTYNERYYNAWRNRTLTAFWQACGIDVIPNVTWSRPDSYCYSFAGIPRHSVVAVNCTAILGHSLSLYLWQKGYNEMLRILNPRLIIRYGDRIAGEDESISIYFPNEHLQRLRRLPKKHK